MFVLVVIGSLSIIAGGLSIFAGLSEGNMFWVAMGLSSAISGVLFLALDKGLTLLTEIRDALTGTPSETVANPSSKPAKPSAWDDAFASDD